LLERGRHGLPAGLIDVPGIDALRVDFSDRPRHCMLTNALGEQRATFGRHLFRVIQPHDAPLGIENNCGGNHRTEQRAAARFVQAGDARPTELTRGAFESRAAQAGHSPRF
jgi:hypothetical protein